MRVPVAGAARLVGRWLVRVARGALGNHGREGSVVRSGRHESAVLLCVCVCVYLYACTCLCVCVCVCVYVGEKAASCAVGYMNSPCCCVCVCVCVCVCLYACSKHRAVLCVYVHVCAFGHHARLETWDHRLVFVRMYTCIMYVFVYVAHRALWTIWDCRVVMCVCVCTCICTRVCVIYMCTRVCVHLCVSIIEHINCTYVFIICMYVFIVCMYV
jgi:hypothetical protein